ncbi:hypothetical protein N9L26_01345 [Candidatus Pacebacteria bacterium]|nr:hypothetical protein [Candidatus Paceibacterota bacterium]
MHSDAAPADTALSPIVTDYLDKVVRVATENDFSVPESCLNTLHDELMLKGITEACERFLPIKHLIVIGVGGSSLGLEAVHSALSDTGVTLHVLDTIAEHKVNNLLTELRDVALEDLLVCSISKSGTTTETLTNTDVLLAKLGDQYGEIPFERTIFVGDPEAPLMLHAKEHGAAVLPMHSAIGGRYSVTTVVGCLPLALLGHNHVAFLEGVRRTVDAEHRTAIGACAEDLHTRLRDGMRVYNFFAIDLRLEDLGRWYRQLAAESLGKGFTKKGAVNPYSYLPVISTPVELHSVGQLYFSGFKEVYTEFVSFENVPSKFHVGESGLVPEMLTGKSMQEILTAIAAGTSGAYEERELAFHDTQLEHDNIEELGEYMGTRMLEVMLLARLLDVDAFNQPNVELYKDITRDVLSN